jgi:hypothetical protein
LAKVHAAGIALLQRRHHPAHVLDRVAPSSSTTAAMAALVLAFRHLLGQVALDDVDLALLLVDQLLAAAFWTS